MPAPPPSTSEIVRRTTTRLAAPQPAPDDKAWLPQSLTHGAAGTALLHIEHAHTGTGTWHQAHRWILAATTGETSAADTTGLYLGAPAIAFMLDAAATGAVDRYQRALADVDRHVAALTHRRVRTATERIRAGVPGEFREYDVFFGLSGLGALLLRRDPGGSALEQVLHYLVALTRPLHIAGRALPGWWVGHDPHRRRSAAYRDGHANLGTAHGISGPLALLGKTMRRGITVDGHREAVDTICAWLDSWKQDTDNGPWWPEWITAADLRRGRPGQPGPARPSWCYGTPGIARAGQQAALAIGDTRLQQSYEHALTRCLEDPAQQSRTTDNGLCHGRAGLYQTVWRAARDSHTPDLAAHLPSLADNLTRHARADPSSGPGLLDGDTGTALALHTAAHDLAPNSGWDACLLID